MNTPHSNGCGAVYSVKDGTPEYERLLGFPTGSWLVFGCFAHARDGACLFELHKRFTECAAETEAFCGFCFTARSSRL
jgi:hypothetical protein